LIWQVEGLVVFSFHEGRFAFFKAPLRWINIAWGIRKAHVWRGSRLEKWMMVVRCLRVRTEEHRIGNSRGGLEVYDPCLTHFLIARHGEELARFGHEAVLELVCEVLSDEDRMVVRVVDYEGVVEVWEGRKTIVSCRRQIDGIAGRLPLPKKPNEAQSE
jgi:hypothetical protein